MIKQMIPSPFRFKTCRHSYCN